MNTEHIPCSGVAPRLRALATMSLLAASAAFAQSSSTDERVNLEKFVVTGSYIPAAADEANASPVTVISAKQIELTGVSSNVLDVLRKAVPQIIGGLNIGAENANVSSGSTNGGSQVALRNTTTLVLIDGMRVAFNPVAGSGGYQFVDLNVVPVAAVERIEVLTDGASAIYGSDAVSGVVNIILKKNYEGLEVGGYVGMAATDKGPYYKDRSMRLVAGASVGKTNLTMSAEWSKSDPLFERDFGYTSPVYLTASYPGVINDAAGNFYRLNPNLNAPPSGPAQSLAAWAAAGVYVPVPGANIAQGFDLSSRPTFKAALSKKIASLALQHALSDTLTFKASLLYSKTDEQHNLNPQPIVFRINSNAGNTGLPGLPFTDVGAQVRNRFVDAGNRYYINVTDSLRGTAELSGKLGDNWTWNASALHNTAKQTAIGTNQILNSALQSAIAAGLINLAAIKQDPVLFAKANIFGDSLQILESKLITYDVRASGRLWHLPAGDLSMALGVGYRKETLSARADKNSVIDPVTGTSAWNQGVTLNPFDQGRNVQAAFVELKVPLTGPAQSVPFAHLMEIDAAVRHEIYSGNDEKPTVPKVGFRWLPFDDQFAVRATYSKSFASPTLYSLFGPSGSGSTPSLVGITAYNSAGQPIGPFPAIQGNQQSGANPNLESSHSKNYTIGLVYSPRALKGLSVSLDYFNIKETDLVGSLAGTVTMIQDVERYGPASIYSPYVRLGNFSQLGGTQVTGPGQLHVNPSNVYVDQFSVNVGRQNQDGLDLTLKYDWTTSYGSFGLSSSWNYIREFVIVAAPAIAPVDYVGTNGYGTLPKLREYTTLSWQSGPYSASVASTYIKSVTSAGDGSKIPSFYTFDVQGGVDLGKLAKRLTGLRVNAGINNLFNKYPPVDASVFSDPPADTGLYGSYGRFYFLDVNYKF